MWDNLAKLVLAGPLTAYYGYKTDNPIVRYGMYALGASIMGVGVYGLYQETKKNKIMKTLGVTPLNNKIKIVDGEVISG